MGEARAEVAAPAGRGARYRGPEGSRYEAEHDYRRPRALHRRVRAAISRPLVTALAGVIPWVYTLYMRFVWWTSTVDDQGHALYEAMARHDRMVNVLWHQEVFTVGWAYRQHTPHTLASTAHFGRIITRILERCGYQVFRGGSSKAKVRQRDVLLSMVRHMQETEDVLYGITVDGSTGPAYQLKPGALLIAKACRAPIYLLRTWASRRITLSTWDRSAIPLPFGRITIFAQGPYWVPPDCKGEELERIRAHIEHELRELAVHAREVVDRLDPAPPLAGFPPGWRRRWVPGLPGLRYGPHDLRPDDPPPWAHRPAHRPPGAPDPRRRARWAAVYPGSPALDLRGEADRSLEE